MPQQFLRYSSLVESFFQWGCICNFFSSTKFPDFMNTWHFSNFQALTCWRSAIGDAKQTHVPQNLRINVFWALILLEANMKINTFKGLIWKRYICSKADLKFMRFLLKDWNSINVEGSSLLLYLWFGSLIWRIYVALTIFQWYMHLRFEVGYTQTLKPGSIPVNGEV